MPHRRLAAHRAALALVAVATGCVLEPNDRRLHDVPQSPALALGDTLPTPTRLFPILPGHSAADTTGVFLPARALRRCDPVPAAAGWVRTSVHGSSQWFIGELAVSVPSRVRVFPPEVTYPPLDTLRRRWWGSHVYIQDTTSYTAPGHVTALAWLDVGISRGYMPHRFPVESRQLSVAECALTTHGGAAVAFAIDWKDRAAWWNPLAGPQSHGQMHVLTAVWPVGPGRWATFSGHTQRIEELPVLWGMLASARVEGVAP
ncbi:hypothetical protein J421_4840 (plasmid) [Gemmatirosa kalamazoonensis]|uniref:Lipoprotein n=1 Tax=Gemmatirosa kalamazoonensis TaxID=861299 RepID=W0RPV8_9BACT|nr:hypothetical protein [Gemmatirosa kalamazoonensis]AHG92375.1 hypothetical protein J421_4840 [Gemmatirosa kalamazoonensis]